MNKMLQYFFDNSEINNPQSLNDFLSLRATTTDDSFRTNLLFR